MTLWPTPQAAYLTSSVWGKIELADMCKRQKQLRHTGAAKRARRLLCLDGTTAVIKNKKRLQIQDDVAADARRMAEEVFMEFDVDASGEVANAEFMPMLQSLGISLTLQEVEWTLAFIDSDGGGSVDIEEFVAWYVASKPPPNVSKRRAMQMEAAKQRAHALRKAKAVLGSYDRVRAWYVLMRRARLKGHFQGLRDYRSYCPPRRWVVQSEQEAAAGRHKVYFFVVCVCVRWFGGRAGRWVNSLVVDGGAGVAGTLKGNGGNGEREIHISRTPLLIPRSSAASALPHTCCIMLLLQICTPLL